MDIQTLEKLMRLSQLRLTPEQSQQALADLDAIFALVEEMQTVDTDDVAPLEHPLDMDQPLREDVVTEDAARAHYQDIAPLTRDGLYLVPKVVE